MITPLDLTILFGLGWLAASSFQFWVLYRVIDRIAGAQRGSLARPGRRTPVRELDLSGEQRRQLHAALLAAFPSQEALARLIRFGFETNLAEITNATTLSDAVFQVMEWVQAQGKTRQLLTVARRHNPDNQQLREFERKL